MCVNSSAHTHIFHKTTGHTSISSFKTIHQSICQSQTLQRQLRRSGWGMLNVNIHSKCWAILDLGMTLPIPSADQNDTILSIITIPTPTCSSHAFTPSITPFPGNVGPATSPQILLICLTPSKNRKSVWQPQKHPTCGCRWSHLYDLVRI